MLLLTDEHVPASVVQLFRERGHEVRLVVDVVAAGSGDAVVVAAADELNAIVVTWDKGFRRRIRRVGGGSLPKAGRILIQCNPATARDRLAGIMDVIEFAYHKRQAQDDKRLIVELRENQLVLHE